MEIRTTVELKTKVDELQQGRSYKVIQITIDGTPRMYFAEHKNGVLHAMILKEVLERHDIRHSEVKVWRGVAPDVRGERYCVDGMGGARLLRDGRVIFFGDSWDYGLKISEAHLEEFQKEYPNWVFSVSPSR